MIAALVAAMFIVLLSRTPVVERQAPDEPYCLFYSAAAVLDWRHPDGNDNGRFTAERLVGDYATVFDPGWARGTPPDPVQLYDGIRSGYGYEVLSLPRYDLDRVEGYVRDGEPVIIYLKVMRLGDGEWLTDAFVVTGFDDRGWWEMQSSAYGAMVFPRWQVEEMYDGWATVIR